MGMAARSRSKYFPPAERATADGLLMIGGKLTTARLIDAYEHGIFPWPVFHDPDPVVWWSPDPRAILPLDAFRVPRRLQRTCRSSRFRVTRDEAFSAVIHGCATAQDRADGTWITTEMIKAYERLHRLGIAHSVEVWFGPHLAGGLYGVALGGLFAAESMFHVERDASKVALVQLVEHLRSRGYLLLDVQMLTDHTARFGAIEIPRREYLSRLAVAIERNTTFGDPGGEGVMSPGEPRHG
jgi:leucyl/phenylalanyl-tRNA--protein transferase